LVDGLVAGTGNSLGRLDLRLAEVLDHRETFIAMRRRNVQGAVIGPRPTVARLKSITDQPVATPQDLSRDCARKPEQVPFLVHRLDQ
jgi:hypothetical protein